MDGEVDGTETQGEEQQGVQGEQTAGVEQSGQAEEVGAKGSEGADGEAGGAGDADYRAALAERDKKIAELEAQIADAAKTVESANALAKQIEELEAATDAERVGYELKLAGCRSVRAGRVLLADHEGDMEALRKAEPWLFGDAGGVGAPGGATGLEPAGAAGGGDGEMERWRAIAGLE